MSAQNVLPQGDVDLEGTVSERNTRGIYMALIESARSIVANMLGSDDDIRIVMRQLAPAIFELALAGPSANSLSERVNDLARREALEYITGNASSWIACLSSKHDNEEAKEQSTSLHDDICYAIREALGRLNSQEMSILENVVIDKKPLVEVAEKHNITPVAVQEILRRAQYKLRAQLVLIGDQWESRCNIPAKP